MNISVLELELFLALFESVEVIVQVLKPSMKDLRLGDLALDLLLEIQPQFDCIGM
jgi:hypothetical protein